MSPKYSYHRDDSEFILAHLGSVKIAFAIALQSIARYTILQYDIFLGCPRDNASNDEGTTTTDTGGIVSYVHSMQSAIS